MIKFEKVSRLKDVDFNLPVRKTANSAGYDFEVAEDIIVPPYTEMFRYLSSQFAQIAMLDENNLIKDEDGNTTSVKVDAQDLKQIGEFTKIYKTKPTLVSTGVKCYLDPGTYLELSVRSSTPLKYWLILANGVGIIDADYADNPDNEGEIFLQLINLGPVPVQLHKGDIIGQGIIKRFEVTDDDAASGERKGGFGSTSELLKPFEELLFSGADEE